MLLDGLDTDPSFAQALTYELGVALAPFENRRFEDGEHKLRPLSDPRGRDVYVLHSLYGGASESPHDKLCHLLMFMATLREHCCARVSAVVPYLACARKDRQTKPFDPVTLRYVAQLFEAVGTTQIFVLEAHNVAAFQNAFRCPTFHLEQAVAVAKRHRLLELEHLLANQKLPGHMGFQAHDLQPRVAVGLGGL